MKKQLAFLLLALGSTSVICMESLPENGINSLETNSPEKENEYFADQKCNDEAVDMIEEISMRPLRWGEVGLALKTSGSHLVQVFATLVRFLKGTELTPLTPPSSPRLEDLDEDATVESTLNSRELVASKED